MGCCPGGPHYLAVKRDTAVLTEVLQVSSHAQVRSSSTQEGGIEETLGISPSPPRPCDPSSALNQGGDNATFPRGLRTASFTPGLVPKKPCGLEGCPPRRSSRCLEGVQQRKHQIVTQLDGWVSRIDGETGQRYHYLWPADLVRDVL